MSLKLFAATTVLGFAISTGAHAAGNVEAGQAKASTLCPAIVWMATVSIPNGRALPVSMSNTLSSR
jgi:hypothetical protein